MKKKKILISLLLCLSSNSLFANATDDTNDYVIVKPNENIKSVISRLGNKKNITYEVYFEDFKLKNSKDLKISNVNELIDYVKNTNGYDITAENKNKSKYQNKLPISLSSLNVPKKEVPKEISKEVPKEDKTASIVNFNQLYVFINESKEPTRDIVDFGSNKKDDVKSENTNLKNSQDLAKATDVNFLKNKIFELAQSNNKIDLLFLKERLREINDLETAKKLIKELERI